MRLKSLPLFGLIALATAALHGQTYWSIAPPDCSNLTRNTPVLLSNGDYACEVSGTFLWFAAGGPPSNYWGTSILLAAPASNPIGVDYTFYDTNGVPINMDTTINGSSTTSSNEVDFALAANQPTVLNMLGATADASSNYSALVDGTVYVQIYCPDETTCENALPQLIYTALPTYPWSLSVPISWDGFASDQWSGVGINNGSSQVVSLAICNYGSAATTFAIDVYNTNGTLVGVGSSPSIPGAQTSTGECGTSGFLLSSAVPNLPTGNLKVLVDGGTSPSFVEMLQVNGPSATTLQVAYDTAPSGSSAVARHANGQSRRSAPALPKVFPPLPR